MRRHCGTAVGVHQPSRAASLLGCTRQRVDPPFKPPTLLNGLGCWFDRGPSEPAAPVPGNRLKQALMARGAGQKYRVMIQLLGLFGWDYLAHFPVSLHRWWASSVPKACLDTPIR